MDYQKVLGKQFDITDDGTIRICRCISCGKNIVLRAGSSAVTRLVSHLNSHGLTLPGTK